jgi:cell division protein FtsI/penicillin-binding protein 2
MDDNGVSALFLSGLARGGSRGSLLAPAGLGFGGEYEMRRSTGSIPAALAGLALVASGLVGCSGDDGPEATLDAFLAGWRDGKLDRVAFIAPTGERVAAADVTAQLKELSGELAAKPPALARQGDPKETGNIAQFEVRVDWTLPGDAHWVYPTTVRLSEGTGDLGWRVIWEPSVVNEKLTEGDALAVSRIAGERAPILDAAGQPIVTKRKVVLVGVQPNEVADPAALVKDLGRVFAEIGGGIDVSDLPARIDAAKPEAFVEVVPLRRPDYDKIRDRLQALDGTRFIEQEWDLAPTRPFARALLGTVDPVQKADMDARPGRYEIGDYVGHGGLQGLFEDRLSGGVGQRILATSKTPEGTVESTEIHRIEPKPGTPVKITLDQRAQLAADAALGPEKRRSALVALRVTDGAVLAVANGPGGGGENLAFTAQVPPGSTFKMVSALALLDAGKLTLDGKVNCPKTFAAGGRSFKNSDNFALGSVPFREAFAKSCNTAFAGLAPQLGADGLAKTGATLGLGGDWKVGVDAFSGKVSTGGSDAERAAASFGQGTTVVSPLAMAAATAAVAKGRWQHPKLVLDPQAAAGPAPEGQPLKATSVQALKTMMREVVTRGTGTALRDTPGGDVYGKTGTAEYDNNPAHTHAWFVGWQGDVAFAVFVEQGGASGSSAVPIADRFLTALAKR